MPDPPPDFDSTQHKHKPPRCFIEDREQLNVKKKKATVSTPTTTQSSTTSSTQPRNDKQTESTPFKFPVPNTMLPRTLMAVVMNLGCKMLKRSQLM